MEKAKTARTSDPSHQADFEQKTELTGFRDHHLALLIKNMRKIYFFRPANRRKL
jgi:hypothetical protein